jgi:hypothetical protein
MRFIEVLAGDQPVIARRSLRKHTLLVDLPGAPIGGTRGVPLATR